MVFISSDHKVGYWWGYVWVGGGWLTSYRGHMYRERERERQKNSSWTDCWLILLFILSVVSNRRSWNINRTQLFSGAKLIFRMRRAKVGLCNRIFRWNSSEICSCFRCLGKKHRPTKMVGEFHGDELIAWTIRTKKQQKPERTTSCDMNHEILNWLLGIRKFHALRCIIPDYNWVVTIPSPDFFQQLTSVNLVTAPLKALWESFTWFNCRDNDTLFLGFFIHLSRSRCCACKQMFDCNLFMDL